MRINFAEGDEGRREPVAPVSPGPIPPPPPPAGGWGVPGGSIGAPANPQK